MRGGVLHSFQGVMTGLDAWDDELWFFLCQGVCCRVLNLEGLSI